MDLQTFEGTWEELQDRRAELAGQRLRVTVLKDRKATEKISPAERAKAFRAWARKKRGPFKQEVDCSRESLYGSRS